MGCAIFIGGRAGITYSPEGEMNKLPAGQYALTEGGSPWRACAITYSPVFSHRFPYGVRQGQGVDQPVHLPANARAPGLYNPSPNGDGTKYPP
jgi:hypothetical protein